MIIAIISGKASAGKTTTAINLGAALAASGHAVRLIDLDSEQRDLTELARAVGLPVQSTLPEEYSADYVLIECPRLEPITRDALKIAHVALIPVPLEYLTIRGLGRAQDAVKGAQRAGNKELQLKAFATMYYARKQSGVRAVLREMLGDALSGVAIPRETAISEAPAAGQSVLAYAPASRGAAAYRKLAKELIHENKTTDGF